MQTSYLQMQQVSAQPVSNQLNAVSFLADKMYKRQCMVIIGEIFFFHFITYSLGCGASCDSSDILA